MHILKHGATTVLVGGFSEKVVTSIPFIGEFLGHRVIDLAKISVGLPYVVALITSIASASLNNWIDRRYFRGPIKTEFCLQRELIHLAVTVITGAVASLIGAWIVGGSQFVISSALIAGGCIGTLCYIALKIVDLISSLETYLFQEKIVTFINDCVEAVETSKEMNTYIPLKIDRNKDDRTKVDFLSDLQNYGWAFVESKKCVNGRIVYANNNSGFIEAKPIVIQILTKEIARLKKVVKQKILFADVNKDNIPLFRQIHQKTMSFAVDEVKRRLMTLENALQCWNDVGMQVKYGTKNEEKIFRKMYRLEIESLLSK